jgi:hypothetical protein
MRWKGRRESKNVDDRRQQPSGGRFRLPGSGGAPGSKRARRPIRIGGNGGFSITSLIIIGVVLWMLGINPLTLLQQSGSDFLPRDSAGERVPVPPANDEMSKFVRVVLAENEDTWSKIFRSAGATYTKPTLVLFSGQVRSACGFASAASGPFYCPGDQQIYIDLGFYEELKRKFKAPGDFAQAYVLAHEVGHHVQNLTGVLPDFNRRRKTMSTTEANKMSIRVELQADCYAGVWGHDAAKKRLLERGDLEEALNAATQIGDDAIQKRLQGYVVPESFNHGTSEQRKRWFNRGFDRGNYEDCDTFSPARI